MPLLGRVPCVFPLSSCASLSLPCFSSTDMQLQHLPLLTNQFPSTSTSPATLTLFPPNTTTNTSAHLSSSSAFSGSVSASTAIATASLCSSSAFHIPKAQHPAFPCSSPSSLPSSFPVVPPTLSPADKQAASKLQMVAASLSASASASVSGSTSSSASASTTQISMSMSIPTNDCSLAHPSASVSASSSSSSSPSHAFMMQSSVSSSSSSSSSSPSVSPMQMVNLNGSNYVLSALQPQPYPMVLIPLQQQQQQQPQPLYTHSLPISAVVAPSPSPSPQPVASTNSPPRLTTISSSSPSTSFLHHLSCVDPTSLFSADEDFRRSRHTKTPHQMKILKQYFQGCNPKPSRQEIQKLMIETQCTYTEICRWFRNERHKEKLGEKKTKQTNNYQNIKTTQTNYNSTAISAANTTGNGSSVPVSSVPASLLNSSPSPSHRSCSSSLPSDRRESLSSVMSESSSDEHTHTHTHSHSGSESSSSHPINHQHTNQQSQTINHPTHHHNHHNQNHHSNHQQHHQSSQTNPNPSASYSDVYSASLPPPLPPLVSASISSQQLKDQSESGMESELLQLHLQQIQQIQMLQQQQQQHQPDQSQLSQQPSQSSNHPPQQQHQLPQQLQQQQQPAQQLQDQPGVFSFSSLPLSDSTSVLDPPPPPSDLHSPLRCCVDSMESRVKHWLHTFCEFSTESQYKALQQLIEITSMNERQCHSSTEIASKLVQQIGNANGITISSPDSSPSSSDHFKQEDHPQQQQQQQNQLPEGSSSSYLNVTVTAADSSSSHPSHTSFPTTADSHVLLSSSSVTQSFPSLPSLLDPSSSSFSCSSFLLPSAGFRKRSHSDSVEELDSNSNTNSFLSQQQSTQNGNGNGTTTTLHTSLENRHGILQVERDGECTSESDQQNKKLRLNEEREHELSLTATSSTNSREEHLIRLTNPPPIVHRSQSATAAVASYYAHQLHQSQSFSLRSSPAYSLHPHPPSF